MSEKVTSLQNKQVKQIVRLRQRRHRDNLGLTVVEGKREVELALRSSVIPRSAYICPSFLDKHDSENIMATLQGLEKSHLTRLYNVTPEVFAKLAYRGETSGVLLVIPYLQRGLADLSLDQNPFLAVIEDVEKPGNLGAILRTADAAGASGVIICSSRDGSGTDIHNPNVIRASLGALFSVPIAAAPTREVIDWLRASEVRIIVSTPAASTPYSEVDMKGPVALVMGSESHGLSDPWFSAADEQVLIPMDGTVNSLNLAVSTALLLYEALRQRTKLERLEANAETAYNKT